MTVDLNSVQNTLKELKDLLESGKGVPTGPVEGPEDRSSDTTSRNRLMSRAEIFTVREELRKRSTPELIAMFDMQLSDGAKRGVGIPYGTWAASGGGAAVNAAMNADPDITKALDSTGGAALIRQDLEPVLYELFVREFPAFDRFAKEPANGLVHAFNQVTSFGDAQFMTELGTVTDDTSVYARQTTNVAVAATRRGVSLKAQFATIQGGAGFNPESLELQGGLRALAHKIQKTIFQGNATTSGGLSTDENGAYDPNGFTGLRSILNTGRAKDVDPLAATPEVMRDAIDRACEEIMNQGGSASIVWLRPTEKVTFDLQQDQNVRYMNDFVNVAPGVNTNAVNTVFGPLPLAVVPGDSIGGYVRSAVNRADMYILDESSISLPFLGSPGPTVLDIPIGISGQLTHLFIMFGMWGMAVKAIPFSNKVRVKTS